MGRADRDGRLLREQRGVALAMVLWFLAAMSLMVSGIVMQARVDTRMAQMHVARAKAAAAGDGAIMLFLADLVGGKIEADPEGGVPAGEYTVGDRQVRVEIVPDAGLIDPRSAPPELLVALLQSSSGSEPGEAELVARNVIGLRYKLLAIEDLLAVEGITKTMLDAMRDSLVVGTGPSKPRKVDWASAPANVRAVFADLDADKFTTRRGDDRRAQAGKDDNKRRAATGKFRLDALVEQDGKLLLRRRWVTASKSSSGSLPWRFTRTEPVRVLVKSEESGE